MVTSRKKCNKISVNETLQKLLSPTLIFSIKISLDVNTTEHLDWSREWNKIKVQELSTQQKILWLRFSSFVDIVLYFFAFHILNIGIIGGGGGRGVFADKEIHFSIIYEEFNSLKKI